MQRTFIAVSQMSANDMFSRCIYQIPVVDIPSILQVQIINLLLKSSISLCICTNQNEECKEPCFMNGVME